MNVKKCNGLADIRKNIDRLDDRIIKLMSERSGYVRQASRFKTEESGVKDESRVAKVLDKIGSLAAKYGMDPEIAREVYKTMINCFINMEMTEFKKNG